MNEILERMIVDLGRVSELHESAVKQLKVACYTEEEFTAKLAMVAAEYLIEMKKRDEEIKQLRKEIYQLNRTIRAYERFKGADYKDTLQLKSEQGWNPKKEKVTDLKVLENLVNLGKTDREICEMLDISRTTLWRRKKKLEEYKETHRKEEEEKQKQVLRLNNLAGETVNQSGNQHLRFKGFMDNDDERDSGNQRYRLNL